MEMMRTLVHEEEDKVWLSTHWCWALSQLISCRSDAISTAIAALWAKNSSSNQIILIHD